jgi:hypothetical protein
VPRFSEGIAKPLRQVHSPFSSSFRYCDVPFPDGPGNAHPTCLHVNVAPFQTEHFTASQPCFPAQESNQQSVRAMAFRCCDQPFVLLKIVESCGRF